MSALSRKTHELVSQAIMSLVLAEPFFGHVLASVNRRVSESCPTAGVGIEGGRPLLVVGPQFFAKTLRRKPERVAVMKHEALHLVLHHCLRAQPGRHDPYLWNVACDLVVNQYIGGKWKLPEGALSLASFPDIALEPGQTVEYYYERLSQASEEARGQAQQSFEDSHSDHSGWGDAEAGSPDASIAEHELGRVLEQARDRAGRRYGEVPGPLRRLVDAAIARRHPQLDWRRVLRMFAASSRRSRLRSTLKRPSKRYGTYPGHKLKRYQRLLVAIDTSGSVSDEALALFFAEVHGMWRQGAEVTVVECDAAVQRVWAYAGHGPPSHVGGRGGTDFDPVFVWMREQRGERWDGAMYLTDGYASTPRVGPPCKLLWIVTRDGSDAELPFGRTVRLQER